LESPPPTPMHVVVAGQETLRKVLFGSTPADLVDWTRQFDAGVAAAAPMAPDNVVATASIDAIAKRFMSPLLNPSLCPDLDT
jgi:hypothetical protein